MQWECMNSWMRNPRPKGSLFVFSRYKAGRMLSPKIMGAKYSPKIVQEEVNHDIERFTPSIKRATKSARPRAKSREINWMAMVMENRRRTPFQLHPERTDIKYRDIPIPRRASSVTTTFTMMLVVSV